MPVVSRRRRRVRHGAESCTQRRVRTFLVAEVRVQSTSDHRGHRDPFGGGYLIDASPLFFGQVDLRPRRRHTAILYSMLGTTTPPHKLRRCQGRLLCRRSTEGDIGFVSSAIDLRNRPLRTIRSRRWRPRIRRSTIRPIGPAITPATARSCELACEALVAASTFTWMDLTALHSWHDVIDAIDNEALANGTYAAVGVVLSGRWAGRRLARQHLRTWGFSTPPGMFDAPIRWFRRLGRTGPVGTRDVGTRDDPRPPPPTQIVGSATPAGGVESSPSWGDERRLMLAVWWWFAVGAAMSGAFALGFVSPFFSVAGATAGAIVGAATGLPAGVAIASWIRSHAGSPIGPRELTMTLEWTGAVGALLGSGLFVWSWAVPAAIGDDTPAAAFVALALASVTGVTLSGRWVGRRLAVHYLATRQLPAPPSWFCSRAGDRRNLH